MRLIGAEPLGLKQGGVCPFGVLRLTYNNCTTKRLRLIGNRSSLVSPPTPTPLAFNTIVCSFAYILLSVCLSVSLFFFACSVNCIFFFSFYISSFFLFFISFICLFVCLFYLFVCLFLCLFLSFLWLTTVCLSFFFCPNITSVVDWA